jgi:sulfur-oxidizing protein SoxA
MIKLPAVLTAPLALLALLGTLGMASAQSELQHPEWQGKGIKAPTPEHPLQEIISGLAFRTPETQEMQEDDFNNPGFLAIERAETAWSRGDGAAGKSCMSCHGDAATGMKGVGAQMPKWNEALKRPVNLEQQINLCRTERMQAEPWKFKSQDLTDMTAYVRHQSRGMPVTPRVDGPMKPWFEKGKELYYTRNGQLDLACASCHEKNHGKFLRADFLSQGQTNGFPVYRLRDQRLIPLHERMEGCIFDVRGEPYKALSDELLALELYIAWRGIGLPVETPAVRN